MRKEGRICKVPVLEIPVNTFWDIGGTAGTAIWVIQTVGVEDRCIDFYEAHNETYAHATRWLNERGYLYNKHFLPHDAAHERQLPDANKSPQQMLEELGLTNTEIVPVIRSLDVGIELMRKYFPMLYMDEERCKAGIEHLDLYKRKFDSRNGTYRNEPEKHDGHSEAPDSLRQYAQAKELNMITLAGSTVSSMGRRPAPDWRTA